MRTMYDAVTPANIPTSAAMVAGYVDGRYAWHADDWARFPGAVKVRIACFASTNDGQVLDVEPGDATPAQAPGWVQRRRAAGVDPTVYCSASAWPSVRAAFAAQGVVEPHWWIAAYPGIGPALYPGSVAHQYANPGPVDISVVADYWPGVDPAPASNVLAATPPVLAPPTLAPPAPLTPTAPEDDMLPLIIWCWTELVGQAPTTDQTITSLRAISPGSNHVQVLDFFLDQPAQASAVDKAYHDYLGRGADPSGLATRTGQPIRQVRADLAAAKAAGAQ